MKVNPLREGDKYCLVFSVEKRKELKIHKKKHKLKEGFYCYVGEHDKDVHGAGNIVFLKRIRDNMKIHQNVKRMSEDVVEFKAAKRVQGHLHYFSDNPLFQLEFHQAINV